MLNSNSYRLRLCNYRNFHGKPHIRIISLTKHYQKGKHVNKD